MEMEAIKAAGLLLIACQKYRGLGVIEPELLLNGSSKITG
jgi:hypothetical protein